MDKRTFYDCAAAVVLGLAIIGAAMFVQRPKPISPELSLEGITAHMEPYGAARDPIDVTAQIRFLTVDGVQEACGAEEGELIIACTFIPLDGGQAEFIFPDPCLFDQENYAFFMCHENGHHNAWVLTGESGHEMFRKSDNGVKRTAETLEIMWPRDNKVLPLPED